LGVGGGGFVFGVGVLPPPPHTPNPQSPIPNPQSPIKELKIFILTIFFKMIFK